MSVVGQTFSRDCCVGYLLDACKFSELTLCNNKQTKNIYYIMPLQILEEGVVKISMA